MHLSIFSLNFAISISNVILKIRSRSPNLYQLFAMSMYYRLNSCKLGQNQLTQSEDNLHLSIFALNLAVLF